MYRRGDLKNIIMTIIRSFPAEAQITRIEFEGPEIAV